MKIFSVDPGDTTGYCLFSPVIGYKIGNGPPIEIHAAGEAEHPDGMSKTLDSIEAVGCDVFLIEDFIVRQSLIGDRVKAIRVIGMCELQAHKMGRIPVIFQQPSHKSYAPDKMLHKLGVPISPSEHITDAIRHAVAYVLRTSNRSKK